MTRRLNLSESWRFGRGGWLSESQELAATRIRKPLANGTASGGLVAGGAKVYTVLHLVFNGELGLPSASRHLSLTKGSEIHF